MDFQIEWYPSNNYSPGRRKYGTQTESILAIVDHITAGAYPGCRDWLCNPEAKASAHYIVTRTGKIIQLVREADTAWHGGIVNQPSWALYEQMGFNPNRWTIGIEHEEYAGDGEPGLTEVQYQASLWLHRQLTAKYSMPIDTEHIVGHYRIDSVDRPNCPGPNFPWDRLFRDLTGAADWKQAIMDVGVRENIIGPGHLADDPSPKWFVVATSLNAVENIKKIIGGNNNG